MADRPVTPTATVNLSKKQLKPEPTSTPKLDAFLSHLPEATVWIVVLTLMLIIRSFTKTVFDDRTTVWIAGLILAFALIYYTVISRYFSDTKRRYIKDLADVIFIGILGTVAKDFSIYLFSLYILPIAAAAFALNILNSLIIATVASIFIAGNVILNTGIIEGFEPGYFGAFQIILLVVMTLFTRALALQLRKEQEERHFFEEKLRQVDRRLVDIEAIEQEFVSITTHQLNTPLSIIRGYTSMLLAGDAGKMTEKQQRYVAEIHGGSLRLTKIIKDLLDITHLDRDQYLQNNHQPVDLKLAIMTSIGREQEKALASNINLIPDLPKQKLVIMGNSTHIEEAITNLINNAIKYSDERTKIIINAKVETGSVGTEVVVNITDQGIGIPAEEQSRIFQRFYRASNSEARDANGTGLGLYIVKRIVEFHGGSVSFSSKARQGTTFTLRFPLVKLSDEATKVKKTKLSRPKNKVRAPGKDQ